MVGRVIDGSAPCLAQFQPIGHREEPGEAATHGVQIVPIDRVRRTRCFVGIAHAEEQATVLEAPVESATQVECHRLSIDVERGVGFGYGDLMTNGASRGGNVDYLADLEQLRSAGT